MWHTLWEIRGNYFSQKTKMSEIVVLKVGGSFLAPDETSLFDFEQAEKLKMTLLPFINSGYRFILTVGGGKIARKYQALLRSGNYDAYDQHYVGTVLCAVNAVMLRAVLGDLAEQEVVALHDFERLKEVEFHKPILVAGGAEPGGSSDYDAALLANHFQTNVVISLKNVSGVFSADPSKDPKAEKLPKLSWDEYFGIVGNKVVHTPGDNLPVDPIAANYSKSRGIKFYILNGQDLKSLENLLHGKEFDGSEIK